MPAPQEPPTVPSPPRPSPPKSAWLEKAAYVVAPGTAVIGLLYYFGSVYTQAYYSGLGIPPSDLEMSFQGIVANSPGAIFLPVCLMLVCGLAVLLVLGKLGHTLARPGYAARRRTVVGSLLGVGLVLLALGLLTFVSAEMTVMLLPNGPVRRYVPPLAVALGATLAFVAVQLRLGQDMEPTNREARTGDRLWLGAGALLIGLASLSLFYDMAHFVSETGHQKAVREAERGYRDSQHVVVHSKVPFAHHAPGIQTADKGSGGGPYRYEYIGFRILAKAPDRFYLVSWASSYDKDRVVVVIPDDSTVWVEIRSA